MILQTGDWKVELEPQGDRLLMTVRNVESPYVYRDISVAPVYAGAESDKIISLEITHDKNWFKDN